MSNFRLKITDHMKNVSFLTRKDGEVRYFTASETPLALSNLLRDRAAETRFAMEDVSDGEHAAKVLMEELSDMWRNNMPLCPKVEEL
jgi:hypothetical protein